MTGLRNFLINDSVQVLLGEKMAIPMKHGGDMVPHQQFVDVESGAVFRHH